MFEKKPVEEHFMYLDPNKPGWYQLVCKHEGPIQMQAIAWFGTLFLTFVSVFGVISLV